MEQAVNAIKDAMKEWGEAFESNDVERIMASVAPNAVFIPPNEPALVGSAAIEAWTRGLLQAMRITALDITVDDVRVGDAWAVCHGQWNMSMTADGETLTDVTRYVVIWEAQSDGSWLAVHDVWNGDLPTASVD